MSEPIRVPMPTRAAFVGDGDVSVTPGPSDPMRVGRRFSFDVSEEVLSKIGGEALAQAVVKMGESIAWAHRPAIDRQLSDRLMRDPAFMAPIIEAAFRESVKELVRERIAAWTDAMMRAEIRASVADVLRSGLYAGDEP